jgi:hypothetical protein
MNKAESAKGGGLPITAKNKERKLFPVFTHRESVAHPENGATDKESGKSSGVSRRSENIREITDPNGKEIDTLFSITASLLSRRK